MKESEDIERSIISKAISEKDMSPLMLGKITEAFFDDDEHANVYIWMQDYQSEYNTCPGEKQLYREFPEYELAATPQPYKYYVDEIKKARKRVLLTESLERMHEFFVVEDIEGAWRSLSADVEAVNTEVTDLLDMNFSEGNVELWEYYQGLSSLPNGLRGITTGFRTMDEITGGLLPEQLITLIGTPKSGKSAILMKMAIAAHDSAYRILAVTFEMSNQEQRDRHTALRAGVSYNRLVSGKLKGLEKRRVADLLKGMDARPDFITIHDASSTTTVSALAAKVAQYKPDVLFVDGVYLMDSELPGVLPGSAQALTSITRSLKRLAQRAKIPVVSSTQALLSKYSPRNGLQLDTIGYTGSFAQDSDVIFGAQEVPDHEEERLLRLIAGRHTGRTSTLLTWDWNLGKIEEIDGSSALLLEDDDPDDGRK